jgi:hypothetical protein
MFEKPTYPNSQSLEMTNEQFVELYLGHVSEMLFGSNITSDKTDRGYIEAKVIPPESMGGVAINILRHYSFYDGETGIQDEICFPPEYGARFQYNFTIEDNGNKKIPTKLTALHRVADGFAKLSQVKGSVIITGGRKKFISDGNSWVTYSQEFEK